MNYDKLHKITIQDNTWFKDAKRRQRWRWLTKYTIVPKIKYYRWKRFLITKLKK